MKIIICYLSGIMFLNGYSNTRTIKVCYQLEFTAWEGTEKEMPFVNVGDGTSTRLYNFIFYNNPYQFDSSFQICLLFNSRPVYSGPYKKNILLSIPSHWFSREEFSIRPGLIIKKDDDVCVIEKTYNDFTWKVNDEQIELGCIFYPEALTLEDRFSIIH